MKKTKTYKLAIHSHDGLMWVKWDNEDEGWIEDEGMILYDDESLTELTKRNTLNGISFFHNQYEVRIIENFRAEIESIVRHRQTRVVMHHQVDKNITPIKRGLTNYLNIFKP